MSLGGNSHGRVMKRHRMIKTRRVGRDLHRCRRQIVKVAASSSTDYGSTIKDEESISTTSRRKHSMTPDDETAATSIVINRRPASFFSTSDESSSARETIVAFPDSSTRSKSRGGGAAPLTSTVTSVDVTTSTAASVAVAVPLTPTPDVVLKTVSTSSRSVAAALPAQDNGPTPLSGSAKTGIFLGSAVCGIAFLALIFWLIYNLVRSRKQRKQLDHAVATFQPSEPPPPTSATTITRPGMVMTETYGPNSTLVRQISYRSDDWKSYKDPSVVNFPRPEATSDPTWRHSRNLMKQNTIIREYSTSSPTSSSSESLREEIVALPSLSRQGSQASSKAPSLKPLMLPQKVYGGGSVMDREKSDDNETLVKIVEVVLPRPSVDRIDAAKVSGPVAPRMERQFQLQPDLTPDTTSNASPISSVDSQTPLRNLAFGSGSISESLIRSDEPLTRRLVCTSPEHMGGFPLPPTSKAGRTPSPFHSQDGHMFPGTICSQFPTPYYAGPQQQPLTYQPYQHQQYQPSQMYQQQEQYQHKLQQQQRQQQRQHQMRQPGVVRSATSAGFVTVEQQQWNNGSQEQPSIPTLSNGLPKRSLTDRRRNNDAGQGQRPYPRLNGYEASRPKYQGPSFAI